MILEFLLISFITVGLLALVLEIDIIVYCTKFLNKDKEWKRLIKNVERGHNDFS